MRKWMLVRDDDFIPATVGWDKSIPNTGQAQELVQYWCDVRNMDVESARRLCPGLLKYHAEIQKV